MSSQRYTPEFKDEAVRQIIERGADRSRSKCILAECLVPLN